VITLLLLACGDPAPPSSPAGGPAGPPVAQVGDDAAAGSAAHPDILLVSIDTLRADRVGAYGDGRAHTPALDGLAAAGALFREAHAVTPLTLPSHASMLTGLLPRRHGLRDNAGFRMAEDIPTLAESLRGAGYRTGAFVAAYVLDSAAGLDQGFDTYVDGFDPRELARVGAFGEVEHPGAAVVEGASRWWGEAAGAPRFAFVHLFEPHAPWVPARAGEASTGDPYRDEVARADAALGRMVERVGPNALIVVVADHGEGLWEHGEREHGLLLGRAATRVPLIIRPPGGLRSTPAGGEAPAARPGLSAVERPAGADPGLLLEAVADAPRAARVIERPVSGVDITPTLLDWAGAPALPSLDGRSLRAAVDGAALDRGAVYAETFVPWFHYGWSGLQMAQDDSLRLEVGAWSRLSDWQSDPSGAAALDRPGDTLAAVIAEGRGEGVLRPGEVSAEATAALAALGYTTADVPAPEGAPDPRDKVAGMAEEARAAAAKGPRDPLLTLSEMADQQPQAFNLRVTLAELRKARGDTRGALDELSRLLERQPEHPQALAGAASLALELSELDRALGLARRLQAVNPKDARGYLAEAQVWTRKEQPAEVRRVCGAGLAAAPEHPELAYLAGLAAIQTQHPSEAPALLLQAQQGGAAAQDIELWLGVAYQQSGQPDAALPHYAAAQAARPGDLRATAMPARMLVEAGRCAEAKPLLLRLVEAGAGDNPTVAQQLRTCGLR
jgi:choline-sulfatase